MYLSEERIRHFSHLIVNGIYFDDLVDYDSAEVVVAEIKRIMTEYLNQDDRIDTFVRNKIGSMSRPVPVGSREWDILYKKYFDEEMNKKNRL